MSIILHEKATATQENFLQLNITYCNNNLVSTYLDCFKCFASAGEGIWFHGFWCWYYLIVQVHHHSIQFVSEVVFTLVAAEYLLKNK